MVTCTGAWGRHREQCQGWGRSGAAGEDDSQELRRAGELQGTAPGSSSQVTESASHESRVTSHQSQGPQAFAEWGWAALPAAPEQWSRDVGRVGPDPGALSPWAGGRCSALVHLPPPCCCWPVTFVLTVLPLNRPPLCLDLLCPQTLAGGVPGGRGGGRRTCPCPRWRAARRRPGQAGARSACSSDQRGPRLARRRRGCRQRLSGARGLHPPAWAAARAPAVRPAPCSRQSLSLEKLPPRTPPPLRKVPLQGADLRL